jgi:predicted CXXCH cytochrome family protein
MKRLLFLGVGSALLFTMGGMGSAQADNGPHSIVMGPNGATTAVSTEGAGQCANCHRAHTAKTSTLTLQAQPALCLNCHAGLGSQLDVVDGVTPSGAALRGGGFTTAAINSGACATKTLLPAVFPSTVGKRASAQISVLTTPTAVTSSHQINGTTTGTMWGNGTSGVGQTAVTLECGACHDPHGNGNYRILKPSPDGQQYVITPGSAVGVTPVVAPVMSTKTAVNIPDQPAKVYTTTNYWDVSAPTTPMTAAENAANVVKAGTVTDGFLGGISAWCTTCHTRYLSAGASVVTGDATYTYKHRSDEQANYKPDCIQCHVAHGTNAAMTGGAAAVSAPDGSAGVVGTAALPTKGIRNADGSYPYNGPALASSGSTGYQNSDLLRVDNRGTCLMCHAVGGPNPLDVVAP